MATNRKSTAASRKRNKKYPRDYKKEVQQQGNATKGGKKKQLKKRAEDNRKRKELGLKKGDKREASRKGGKFVKESGKKNSRRQPKRKKG
jgi:hypothetical protein